MNGDGSRKDIYDVYIEKNTLVYINLYKNISALSSQNNIEVVYAAGDLLIK